MTTPVIIMAVPFIPERLKNAVELKKATGGEIVLDQKRSVMHTFTLVLEEAGQDPVIILQDDVYLAQDWRAKVEAVIAEHPTSVCQFFSLRKSDLEHGARWQPGSAYLANTCFYLPKGYAAELLEFTREWIEQNPEHTGDDTCLSEWLASRKERYWHHVPSLVQHHVWKSAINDRRSSKRQSPTFEETA